MFATPVNGKNIVENNNPQKIKPLFKILSAKNPKMGCKSCENTGVSGKVIAFETLVVDNMVREMLLNEKLFTSENIKDIKTYYPFKKYLFNLLKDKKISGSVFSEYFTW